VSLERDTVVMATRACCFCTLRVQPFHGWMMRHDCPLAMLTMHPPSHPLGVQQMQHSTQMTMT
jgi:hypothetical protein